MVIVIFGAYEGILNMDLDRDKTRWWLFYVAWDGEMRSGIIFRRILSISWMR